MDPGKGISEEARKKMESGIFHGSLPIDADRLDILPANVDDSADIRIQIICALGMAGNLRDAVIPAVNVGSSISGRIDPHDLLFLNSRFLNRQIQTLLGAHHRTAAGTGRFLEMMAKTLGLSLEEMSVKGLEWKHNIVISSMCTVFAESEVVSLVAQNKDVADIIHGLNVSVASKVGALAARLGKDHPGEYMMTGGVAKNQGIIQALEEKLGAKLYICDEAQLCGALGAALFAYEKCKGSAEETR